ncbi:MAG TPA: monovalent cation/H(+) antiporter subunit G [Rhodospirillales bacterium]|nr:monovalent cation/H(+) antiporter subunit G [Rhodospirillales bacterium]
MVLALDIVSWALIICGGVFAIIGGIGMIRLPDFFTRIHAAGVIETMGAGAIFAGLIIQAGWSMIAVKLVLMAIFMLFTNPTATHAIARAALGEGLIPLTDDEVEEDLSGYVLSDLDMLELEADSKETDPSKT